MEHLAQNSLSGEKATQIAVIKILPSRCCGRDKLVDCRRLPLLVRPACHPDNVTYTYSLFHPKPSFITLKETFFFSRNLLCKSAEENREKGFFILSYVFIGVLVRENATKVFVKCLFCASIFETKTIKIYLWSLNEFVKLTINNYLWIL